MSTTYRRRLDRQTVRPLLVSNVSSASRSHSLALLVFGHSAACGLAPARPKKRPQRDVHRGRSNLDTRRWTGGAVPSGSPALAYHSQVRVDLSRCAMNGSRVVDLLGLTGR
jgi:hypothetical protein